MSTQKPAHLRPRISSQLNHIKPLGLAKKLRLCGVDAVALDNGQSSDVCIDFYEKERRVVLSKGAAYTRLCKFVPTEYVCNVESEGAREQLLEVLDAFEVTMGNADLFTRCTKCNSCTYISVPSFVIKTLLECDGHLEWKADDWIDCEGGQVNLASGCIGSGARICLKKVTKEVADHVKNFRVCAQCGKCYWGRFSSADCVEEYKKSVCEHQSF